jgi:hypothetical protein
MSNTLKLSILVATMAIVIGVGILISSNAANATATAVGYPYYTKAYQAGRTLAIPIDWGTTSSDAAVTVTIPSSYGCPTGIIGTVFEDTAGDTGDSAKSAAALGEYCYMTPADWGAADLEDNQLTVYRNDIGGGTFTINLRSYVIFWWLPNG